MNNDYLNFDIEEKPILGYYYLKFYANELGNTLRVPSSIRPKLLTQLMLKLFFQIEWKIV